MDCFIVPSLLLWDYMHKKEKKSFRYIQHPIGSNRYSNEGLIWSILQVLQESELPTLRHQSFF